MSNGASLLETLSELWSLGPRVSDWTPARAGPGSQGWHRMLGVCLSGIAASPFQAQQQKLREQWKVLQDMFNGDHVNKDPKQWHQHLEKIFALANTVSTLLFVIAF